MSGETAVEAPSLEFRVLGPLEARRGGEPLKLGGERQRALLALLLLRANELVSSELIVDQVFGGEAGGTGLNALRVAISRLRRLLDGGAEPATLVTGAGGYMLELEPERLDAMRFERLLREGQQALAADAPVQAAELLNDALGLWRGAPLADLALLEFVQPEVRRLEELRLLAQMERIDAELALGRGDELIAEIERLSTANPLQERLRGQLMLALYRAGRQADALRVYRDTSTLLRDELGLEPSRALQELERLILQQDASLEPAPPPAAGSAVGVCPFKGLAFFDRVDAEYFCGRERLVADLVTRAGGASLLGIIGPSGIGKSSLLRAGLLPALSAGALPGSGGWRQHLLRPGASPLTAMRTALGAESADGALRRLEPGRRFILAIDQLEELFTVCADEAERAAVIDELTRLTSDPDRRALVLVALRADLYGRFAQYPEFARLLSGSHVLVGPMGRDELTRAIQLPAARAGLTVEPALVDALLDQVTGRPGALPHLSTVLLELWRLRDGSVLRHSTFLASGGVRGAVARMAEDAYSELPPDQRPLVKKIMLRLVADDQGSPVRRRAPRAALTDTHTDTDAGAETVLELLAERRLVTVDDAAVEIAHESLLTEWPRLRDWLEEDEAGRRVHAHLSASARDWEQRGRDAGDLYRGARLAAALEWAGQHAGELNAAERAYLQASRDAAEREGRRQRRLNRRLRGSLLVVIALLAIAVAAGVVALAKQHTATAAARAALARQLGAQAVSAPRIDQAMLLAHEAVALDRTPDTESTLLATLLRSPRAIATFTLPLGSRPQAVALSPDGSTLAVPDNNAGIHLFDTRTHGLTRTIRDGGADVSFTPDGTRIAYFAASSPVLELRSVGSGTLQRSLKITDPVLLRGQIDEDPASSHFFSPHGDTFYYVYWALDANGAPARTYVDRWSLASGRELPTVPLGRGVAIAGLVDGGRHLVAVGPAGEAIYDAASMRRLSARAIPASSGLIAGAISPDGRRAVLATAGGALQFMDLATGRLTAGRGGDATAVAAVVYSPDGRQVVSTGNDDVVQLWDPTTGQAGDALTGHAGEVHGAAISADGATLYTVSLDGVVFAWDLRGSRGFGRSAVVGSLAACCPPEVPGIPPLAVAPDGSRFATRTSPSTIGIVSTSTMAASSRITVGRATGVPTTVAWSAARNLLAAGGSRGPVQLWDMSPRPRGTRIVRTFSGLHGAVHALAFSPDGRSIAAIDLAQRPSGPDGDLAIWRTATGRLAFPVRDLHAFPRAVAFSPDGRLVAVALDDGRVELLAASDGRPVRTLRPQGTGQFLGTTAVAFAPDGTLATGSWGGFVELWNPRTGARIGGPVLVAAAPVASLAFDRTGARLATAGGQDGSVKLWFTRTLQQEGSSLSPEHDSWGAVSFTPDGARLIAVQDDGRAWVWPVTVAAWMRHACAVAGRDFTREEWARYVSGLSYQRTCPTGGADG